MKRVYVVSVQWKQNDKWYNAPLHAFSNRRAAQSYIEIKEAMAAEDPDMESRHYYIDRLTCWTYNFLKEE